VLVAILTETTVRAKPWRLAEHGERETLKYRLRTDRGGPDNPQRMMGLQAAGAQGKGWGTLLTETSLQLE
jgi:hypothetical protein